MDIVKALTTLGEAYHPEDEYVRHSLIFVTGGHDRIKSPGFEWDINPPINHVIAYSIDNIILPLSWSNSNASEQYVLVCSDKLANSSTSQLRLNGRSTNAIAAVKKTNQWCLNTSIPFCAVDPIATFQSVDFSLKDVEGLPIFIPVEENEFWAVSITLITK